MKGNLVNGIRATLFREFEVLNAHNLLSVRLLTPKYVASLLCSAIHLFLL